MKRVLISLLSLTLVFVFKVNGATALRAAIITSIDSVIENDKQDNYGAIVRKNKNTKEVRLIFSVDEAFEGGSHILNVLKEYNVKGSFFLTGKALRNPEFKDIIDQILEEGHYLGGHSDNHLLYAEWGTRESLVTTDSLLFDLKNNCKELEAKGISKAEAKYYLPPFEWYNSSNVQDIKSFGWEAINFTTGLRLAADYTTPEMKNYMSSQQLIDHLIKFEETESLDGAIILIHPGTVKERTDKLYNRLNEIIELLDSKGYKLQRF